MKKILLGTSVIALFSSSLAFANDTPPEDQEPGPKRAQQAAETAPPPHVSSEFLPTRAFRTRVEVAEVVRERYNRLSEEVRAATPITKDFAVHGKVLLPVMLFKYKNTSSDPFPFKEMDNRLFSEVRGKKSVTNHYLEMSNNLLTLSGKVYDWVQLDNNDTYYEDKNERTCRQNCDKNNGHAFLEALIAHDTKIDFRDYDNDGPDGDPDSGDDDGFVDFPAFVHSESGGECGNSNIWSHKFYMSSWLGDPDGYKTDDISKITKKPIRIDDYVVMPGLHCDGVSMNDIGVFSHEFGHAFRIPDLYDTSSRSSGAGGWALMAAGSWGGPGYGEPETPTHMTAWSKQYLGWVNPLEIKEDTMGVVIGPYALSNNVIKVNYPIEIDPFDEKYLLLEYRDQIGFDSSLVESGLLVTQINNTRIRLGQTNNRVNYEPYDQGVDVIEADGGHQLTHGINRADTGDVFPGSSNTREISSASYEPIDVAVCNINKVRGNMVVDIYVSRNTCPSSPLEIVQPIKSAPAGSKSGLGTVIDKMLKSDN